MTTWVTDNDGNRCSVEYFGSREEAQAALDSLKNCKNCTNCSYCSDCSDCSGKSDRAAGGEPPIPTIQGIHKAVYAAALQPGCFEMEHWHCGTTHCRAGWVVTLAGDAGKALEKFYNTELAAMLIYRASDPEFKINPARFYDSNEDALADMKQLAEGAKP